jgi:hypothetical protein
MSEPGQLAGKSILDILWEELDSVFDQLMEEGEPDVDPTKQPSTAATRYREWGELRGQAQGLAYAIAVMTNPYEVDVPAIKVQVRERYEAANEDD